MSQRRIGIRGLAALLTLSLAIGGFSACGGGAAVTAPASPGGTPSEGTPPAGETALVSDSYSPTLVLGADGEPATVTWDYLVNGGRTLGVDADGTVGEISFAEPMHVTWDPENSMRTSSVPFTMTGTMPGVEGTLTRTGVALLMERVEVSQGATHVVSRGSMCSLGTTDRAENLSRMSMSQLMLAEPLDWLPDRTDLLDLENGTVFGAGREVLGGASGSVEDRVPGLAESGGPFDWAATLPEQWTIVDKLAELAVGGMTYRDVVVVDLVTLLPDLACPDRVPGEGESTTTRMWFARGVGLIKATNLYTLWGSPVDVELLASNLKQR